MALRVPTLRNSCGPSSTGTDTLRITSSGAKVFCFGPTINPSRPTSRLPRTEQMVMRASRAASGGSVSPAGDAVARFPPSVPALRIWGEPTVRAACARAGT